MLNLVLVDYSELRYWLSVADDHGHRDVIGRHSRDVEMAVKQGARQKFKVFVEISQIIRNEAVKRATIQ